MTNADGGGYGIVRGVDDGDGVGAGVDGINLVADGVDGEAGGLAADLEDPVLAQVNEIKDGNGARLAVGNVCELTVIGRVIGETVAMAAGKRQRQ